LKTKRWNSTPMHTRKNRSAPDSHAAIARLPVIERQVVTLRLDGVASVDIARQFGMSPANVTHIHHRAVKRLKQILTGEGAL
jgi:DNA-directed RNA polymerase specialized sigma24 family protein